MESKDEPLIKTSSELDGIVMFSPTLRAKIQQIPDLPAAEFVAALIEKHFYKDACRVLPFFMDNRTAAWWACLCIWRSLGKSLVLAEYRALDACIKWVIDPSVQHRKTVHDLADEAGETTPAGCLGKAISVSDCVPTGEPVIPGPKPFLSARLVYMSTLACYFLGGRQAELRQAFAVIGLEVLSGRDLWDLPPEAAAGGSWARGIVTES